MMTDDELLNVIRSEYTRSIGFDLDAELTAQRRRALLYYKGEMPDQLAPPKRSTAVSRDVRDAINAVLPDLMDVFSGDDDVVAFLPVGPEDEPAAEQETDYTKYVVFRENNGWALLSDWFLDALQAKVGVVKWWGEEGDQPDDEMFEGKTAVEMEMVGAHGELIDVKLCDNHEACMAAGEQLYDFKVRYPQEDGAVKIAVVAPEDITVARDTRELAKATYCATRSRPRVQDLIYDGIDEDLLEDLPEWRESTGNSERIARDTVLEGELRGGNAELNLRQVEVTEHYIRLRDKKGEKILCVLTGGNGSDLRLLRKQEVNQIQLAAITPYRISHHFYGQSLADMVMDVQQIKTQLQRMLMDSGYFALNQRHEIDMSKANEWTVSDYLRNEPGSPVRTKGNGQAITPISSPSLGFDTLAGLEYFTNVIEDRTGIVRAAQGLNPDALHDTKGGMLAMLSRAQKKIRHIAQAFAQTGVKDLYLGVHAVLRQNASKARIVQLRGVWTEVDPSSWGERMNMAVEVGHGAGNRDYDLASIEKLIEMQAQAVQAQGGIEGPLVGAEQLHASATLYAKKAGFKAVERFFKDPATEQPKEPGLDPAMIEAQAKMQAQAQADQAKAELDRYRFDQEMAFKREQFDQEIALKERQLVEELRLKERLALFEAQTNQSISQDSNVSSDVRMGGEPG